MIQKVILLSLLPAILFAADPPSTKQTDRLLRGKVFVDADGDGVAGKTDKTLSGVTVSDGLALVKTDSSGSYQIPVRSSYQPRFVFVETPAGYRSGKTGFYRKLPESNAVNSSLDFALLPAPERARKDFSFVQITDTHIGADVAIPSDLDQSLKECAALDPAFIMHTGDMTDKYQPEQFRDYHAACSNLSIEVYPCVGNHDVPYYEKFCGPPYYAFDCGNVHFIELNSSISWADTPQQFEWLKRDMELQNDEKTIIVFQHIPPSGNKLPYWGSNITLMELLSLYNVKAFFTGHWHSSKVYRYDNKVLSVNSPPLSFGGLDSGLRGFVQVSVSGGKITLDQRLSGCRKALTIIYPGEGTSVPRKELTVSVNAYDAATINPKVECRLDDGNWQAMSSKGKWTWQAKQNAGPGKHDLQVRARWDDGTVTEKQISFSVDSTATAAPQPGADWPMFKRNPERSSVADDSVAPPLDLRWIAPMGGTILLSSPVISGKTVFVGVADEDLAGHSGVYAMNATDGKVKWSFPTATSVKHTVSVAGNRVYAVTVEGIVHALDAETGKSLWTYSLGNPDTTWAFASPLVMDGVVYVGVADSFVALEAATGKKLWQAAKMGTEWISSPSSPASDKTNIFVAFNRGKGCFALDARTGKTMWSHGDLRINFATPAVNTGASAVYQPGCCWSSPARFYTFNTATGKELWSFEIFDGWPHYSPFSSPALGKSGIFFGSPDGEMLCLDLDGKEKWKVELGKPTPEFTPYFVEHSPVISSPTLSGNIVYVGTLDGRLVALNASSGEQQWEYKLGAPIMSSPTVSGNMVLISAVDGNVYAFTSNGSAGKGNK